jgi:hypothetical protein
MAAVALLQGLALGSHSLRAALCPLGDAASAGGLDFDARGGAVWQHLAQGLASFDPPVALAQILQVQGSSLRMGEASTLASTRSALRSRIAP